MTTEQRDRLRAALMEQGWRISEDKPERLCAEVECPPTQFLQLTFTCRLNGELVADISIWDWSTQQYGEINLLDPVVRQAIAAVWACLDADGGQRHG